MAQHMQDPAVFERRLRPIYDSLESGNNKKALQDVEKLLKKHPSITCARALKALALLRLGRDDESNTLLASVTDERPTDDATLQVLTFCYKEMEQLEKICDLYIYAAKQFPGNEEILAHLFISYVRMDDYKAQQKIALQLYKSNPKNPYYFWAVMSVVLQAIRGPESKLPEKRKIYLSLAQAMVDKLIKGDKLEAEQEVQLYLNILEEQGKFQESLDCLVGPVCEKFYPGAPVYVKINLMKKLGMWSEINTLLKVLLSEEHDRWDYYQDYLTSCFELHKINPDSDEGIPVMDATHEFLCELIESDGKKVRGPYLARLELHKRMRETNLNANDLLGDFTELVTEYFRLFGNKSCCTHDISLFLNSMTVKERSNLAANIIRESGINPTKLPQNKDEMQKHICSLQLSRICGSHIDLETDHLLALYTALKLHYENGLSAFGRNLLPTDMGPSDPYALLAANVMYDISIKEKNSKHLLEALCLLQYVLKNSPSNFHVKLLCLKIYHILGCTVGAQQMYDSLDIKHIQLDSMGYLHCNLLPLCGRFAFTKLTYDTTLKFFTTSYKERLEYIAMSYKFGSFSKLLEFMDFRDRLSNSLHYAMISAEELLMELVSLYGTVQQNLNTFKLMAINPQNDRIHWNELADNRDLSVVVRWDPINLVDKSEESQESFNQDVETLQIRSTLLRLVSSFIELFQIPCKTNENNEKSNETETIELLKDTWDGLFQRIRLMNYKKSSNQFLVNLLPSRLHLLLEMPYEKFFTDLAKFIIDLYTGKLKTEQQNCLNESVTAIAAIFLNAIDDHNSCSDDLWMRREVQCKVAASVEILSLYAFVLSVCHEKYLATSQNAQSKKYKRKDSKSLNEENVNRLLNDRDRFQITVELMRHLKQNLQNCGNAIGTWKPSQIPTDLSDGMSSMRLQPEVETNLLKEINDVFKENNDLIVSELRNLIKDKIRMVNK